MAPKQTSEAKAHGVIEKVLGQIIDEWYERVCPHYVTSDQILDNPALKEREEELKRFHDAKGHRIKFNKDDLDFTYGLKSYWQGESYIIEISVNNKVDKFDYADFGKRLLLHYSKTSGDSVPTPYKLRKYSYQDIFQLEPNPEEAFTVEPHQDKADIMRLSFRLRNQLTRNLAAHPLSSKQLIEDYCVSPFRRIFARVYRQKVSESPILAGIGYKSLNSPFPFAGLSIFNCLFGGT